LVAIFIGGLEAFGLVGDKLGFENTGWSTIHRLNDDIAFLGYIVVGIIIASWILSTLVFYRFKGYHKISTENTRPNRTNSSVEELII
jgi:nickel/cobalt transporter (NiCoT) family protein